MTLGEFLTSSATDGTWWYKDSRTGEGVCFCKSCGAEWRFTVDTLWELRFAHKDSCPYSDEKRARRLVDAMTSVLEEETDNHVALSAITWLAVTMCAIAAEDDGVPLETVTNRFGQMFEERTHQIERLIADESNHDNAA
jgi:hypothetical protein